jgi:hypothetical protein
MADLKHSLNSNAWRKYYAALRDTLQTPPARLTFSHASPPLAVPASDNVSFWRMHAQTGSHLPNMKSYEGDGEGVNITHLDIALPASHHLLPCQPLHTTCSSFETIDTLQSRCYNTLVSIRPRFKSKKGKDADSDAVVIRPVAVA